MFSFFMRTFLNFALACGAGCRGFFFGRRVVSSTFNKSLAFAFVARIRYYYITYSAITLCF